jgi:hypothetical protein
MGPLVDQTETNQTSAGIGCANLPASTIGHFFLSRWANGGVALFPLDPGQRCVASHPEAGRGLTL